MEGEEEAVPLEVSLRNLIAMQKTLIEDLRAQNSRELAQQKVDLREELLETLRPMVSQSSAPAAGRSKISKSSVASMPKRRRPRPRSRDGDRVGSSEEGTS